MNRMTLLLISLLFIVPCVTADFDFYNELEHNVTYGNNLFSNNDNFNNNSCMYNNASDASCSDFMADFYTCVNSYVTIGDETFNCEWAGGCYLFSANNCSTKNSPLYFNGVQDEFFVHWWDHDFEDNTITDNCTYNISAQLWIQGLLANETNILKNETNGTFEFYYNNQFPIFAGSCSNIKNLDIYSLIFITKTGLGTGEYCNVAFSTHLEGYSKAILNCSDNSTYFYTEENITLNTTTTTTSSSTTTSGGTTTTGGGTTTTNIVTTTTGGGTTTAPGGLGGGTLPNAWPTSTNYPNVGQGNRPGLNGGTIPGGPGGLANTTGLGASVMGVQTSDFLKWVASGIVLGALLLCSSNLSLGAGLALILTDFFVLVMPWMAGFPPSLLLYLHFLGISTFFIKK